MFHSADLHLSNKVIYGFSWSIPRQKVLQLHKLIQAEVGQEIHYQVLGDRSLFVSDSSKGHNCFTWAREKLLKLEHPQIVADIGTKPYDRIGTDPRQYIKKVGPQSGSNLSAKENCLLM